MRVNELFFTRLNVLFAFAALAALAGTAWSARAAQLPVTKVKLEELNAHWVTAWPTQVGNPSVFLFIAHDCPISNAYAPELARIETRFEAQGVKFWEVYSESDLTVTDARKHHQAFGLKGNGFLDPHTKLAKLLKAKVTPEAIVVSAKGEVIYRGRIDDTYASVGVRRQVTTQHDLIDVLSSAIKGVQPSENKTPAYGCAIILKN